MKKKLLITVGAGASLDFGLPSVKQVDNLLDAHAMTLYPLLSDLSSNLYRYCRDAIQAYYDGAPKPALRKSVNFEEVLYQLNLLAPHYSDVDRLHGSNALLNAVTLPDVFEFGLESKPVDANVLSVLAANLIDYLVDHFIESCGSARINKSSEIGELRHFLMALRDEFDIGVVTLNYDDIFTQALPGLYTGFDPTTGTFEPVDVLSRSNWDFIYHLHGSIHFAMAGSNPYDMHGISWVSTPSSGHNVEAFGRNNQASLEGPAFPTSIIVAGYGKTQQILRQPFLTFFAQMSRLVHEADSLLFIGYGFGDLHLNAAFSEVRNRRRPAVVIDYASDHQDPLRWRHDNWSYHLLKTLPVDLFRFAKPGHISPSGVGELKAQNEVECSNDPNAPLAIWYNGFLPACQNLHKLLPHLK